MTFKIFVEGIADIKFVSDYISHKYNIIVSRTDIIETNGWTGIYSENKDELVKTKMLSNTENDGKNILIFDADANFEVRLSEINDWKVKNKLIFDTFLWPDNANSGDLETVLENIINQNNAVIFDCWNKYELCLGAKEIEGRIEPLTIPARKTKIYGYLEALLGSTKSQKELIKEKNRNYRNLEFWDLDSEYLAPFEEFLDAYFSK